MTNQELAQTIVQKILENLKDRRGFRHLLESIELENPEIYQEIVTDLVSITENTMKEKTK